MEDCKRLSRKVESQRKELEYLNSIGGNKAVRKAFAEIDRLRMENAMLSREKSRYYRDCCMYQEMLRDAKESYVSLLMAFAERMGLH